MANAVRELTKVLDGATLAAYKELMRVIEYVLDTKEMALQIEPEIDVDNKKWQMMAFSDSDYAGDAESRTSVLG